MNEIINTNETANYHIELNQQEAPTVTPESTEEPQVTPNQPEQQLNTTIEQEPLDNTADEGDKKKKRVRFPNNIIKGYSDPPKKWKPGEYSTTDLLDSYCKACEKQKCKPSAKLMQQLKALQDLDGINGEKVNVLNLKNERLDIRQVEALEEVFKRLSFKTVDLDGSYFEGEESASTLFEILDYYDTCEKLILANNRTINILGLQALSKLLRKSICVENVDMRGHTFPDYYQFSYFARGIRLSTCLRVLHFECSNIQGKLLILLLNALKDNQYVKELYLNENKLQPNDGMYIGGFLKENKHLELLDLRTNQLQDLGLSHICSGLSEQCDINGLKVLVLMNNNITINGLSYLSKALIHNQSLTHLNVSQNVLTNEGVFALKEALISNKLIDTLIMQKSRITDEGAIALAEFLAETQSLIRLDLRENDIRLGGIMALTSSLRLNRTLIRLDIDKELKKDAYIKDYNEQAKRLFQEIAEYVSRNKSIKAEREAQLQSILSNDLFLEITDSSERRQRDAQLRSILGEFGDASSETVFIDKTDLDEAEEQQKQQQSEECAIQVDEEELKLKDVDDDDDDMANIDDLNDIDQMIEESDDLIKTIYMNHNTSVMTTAHLDVIVEQESGETRGDDLYEFFDEANDYQVVNSSESRTDEKMDTGEFAVTSNGEEDLRQVERVTEIGETVEEKEVEAIDEVQEMTDNESQTETVSTNGDSVSGAVETIAKESVSSELSERQLDVLVSEEDEPKNEPETTAVEQIVCERDVEPFEAEKTVTADKTEEVTTESTIQIEESLVTTTTTMTTTDSNEPSSSVAESQDELLKSNSDETIFDDEKERSTVAATTTTDVESNRSEINDSFLESLINPTTALIDVKITGDDSFDIESNPSNSNDNSFQVHQSGHQPVDIESIINAQLTINLNNNNNEANDNVKQTSRALNNTKALNKKYANDDLDGDDEDHVDHGAVKGRTILIENDDSDIEVLAGSLENVQPIQTKTSSSIAIIQLNELKSLSSLMDTFEKKKDDDKDEEEEDNKNVFLSSICETDATIFDTAISKTTEQQCEVADEFGTAAATLGIRPFFTSKLTNSQLSEEILNEIGLK